MDDAQLRTVWQQRQPVRRFCHISEPLAILMKHDLARKVRQLSGLVKIWDEVIPAEIAPHTALKSFTRGVLTVMVDSAVHRFQLQTLLTGGLLKYIRQRFAGAIDRVRLVPGQFDVVGTGRTAS